jgi:hypothetical protein
VLGQVQSAGNWLRMPHHPEPLAVRAGCVHPYPAIRLRGLPFGASKEEIADFLGVVPIDIVFQERGGRPNGVAFVLCANLVDHQQAISQDKQNLGTRYIEVFPCIRTVRAHAAIGRYALRPCGHRPAPASLVFTAAS